LEKKSRNERFTEDFRLFHIREQEAQDFECRHHDFDKIIVFLSGSVTYIMEGKSYSPKAWDILLVGRNQIHHPIIEPALPYERIVLCLNPDFLAKNTWDGEDLLCCFQLAREKNFSLLRPAPSTRQLLQRLLQDTENAMYSEAFGHSLLSRIYFLQFMVELNRMALSDYPETGQNVCRSDPKFNEIIAYIHENLHADLSLDALSARFYISKSYLMHKFKDMTGCSAHSYIQQKRLLHAAEQIREGMPVLLAAKKNGFNDYSAFLRAFKRLFGVTPRDFS